MKIKGTKGNDNGVDRPALIGSAEEDRIFGLAGDHAISGGGGDDGDRIADLVIQLVGAPALAATDLVL